MNYLVDVNVWLALALIGHTHQATAQNWFETTDAQGSFFCRITQKGFLRLLTNRPVMGANVLTSAEAWKLYDAFFQDGRVRFAAEPTGIETGGRTQTGGHPSGPNSWTDAYLAAFAAAADLTLVTFDRAFARRKDVSAQVLR
ncbi:MAG: TA system VapC family ribonuclease toxin [Bryobacteraceae bacterium]